MNQRLEKFRLALWDLLPIRWRNQFAAIHLGQLVVLDTRLHTREVPTITAEEFMDAMRATEGR